MVKAMLTILRSVHLIHFNIQIGGHQAIELKTKESYREVTLGKIMTRKVICVDWHHRRR